MGKKRNKEIDTKGLRKLPAGMPGGSAAFFAAGIMES
jgi:hypothetical protein